MTPERLVPLVARALARPGSQHELLDWSDVLRHTTDDDGDQALQLHRSTSPHPPTPADVRRLAIGLANDRAAREIVHRRRLEVQTGIAQEGDHAGQPLVPMPAEIREGLRLITTRHQVPDDTDLDDTERLAQARAELAARQPIPLPDEPTASTG